MPPTTSSNKRKWVASPSTPGSAVNAVSGLRRSLTNRHVQLEMCTRLSTVLKQVGTYSNAFRVVSVSTYAAVDALEVVATAKDAGAFLVFSKKIYDAEVHGAILQGKSPVELLLSIDGWSCSGVVRTELQTISGDRIRRTAKHVPTVGRPLSNVILLGRGNNMDKYGTPMDMVEEMVKTAGVTEEEALTQVSAGKVPKVPASAPARKIAPHKVHIPTQPEEGKE